MSVVVTEKHNGRDLCSLVIEQEGMTVVVKAGAIKWKDEDLSLNQDESFSIVSDVDHVKTVVGYIVREVSTGDLMLLVDEVLQNGSDRSYRFERNGPYHCIHRLIYFHVPAGAESLDDVDIRVSHSVSVEE